MCGRYALYGREPELAGRFDLKACPDYAPRYNIAPQSEIPVVRHRPDVGRVAQMVRWGLVPSWAKEPSIGAKLNNARAESVAEKPSFRSSFSKHRCIIPANGFYEWQTVIRDGKTIKQPWFIRPEKDDEFFAMAGLLARWVTPEGSNLITTCVITTGPNEVMAPIHDRMPVMLANDDIDGWLDPTNLDKEGLLTLLKPAPNLMMRAFRVSSAVSRAGNDGPELIEPVTIE